MGKYLIETKPEKIKNRKSKPKPGAGTEKVLGGNTSNQLNNYYGCKYRGREKQEKNWAWAQFCVGPNLLFFCLCWTGSVVFGL